MERVTEVVVAQHLVCPCCDVADVCILGAEASVGDGAGRLHVDEDMMDELHELMEKAPDEMTKKEFRKFIDKIETM